MKKTSNDAVSIDENAYVKVTKMNHIIEVQHMEKMNRSARIQKLDKDTYVEIATGEIKEFEHGSTRQDNINGLQKTFKKLRYLINNNFVGAANELHVTLTYKENMTDTKRLYDDFKRFMTRLKRSYKAISSIDYISVVEPQGRGAWHCHVLMRFNDLPGVYIKNKDLRALWGLGFVKIKSLKDVDNIGAYLSAYLADLEIEGDSLKAAERKGVEIVTKNVDGVDKKFVKGARLHLYPSGMNLFRKSKGMIYPEREEMTFGQIKKAVGTAIPHYQKSITIQDGEFQNTISYLQFNMKR